MPLNDVTGLSSRISLPPALEPSDKTFTLSPASNGPLGGANVTLLSPVGQADGPGGMIRISLQAPTIGPEDVPLNEVLQQLQGLGELPLPVFLASSAVAELAEGASATARQLRSVAKNSATAQPQTQQVIDNSTAVATQAMTIEAALRHQIENSTYPNFSDFLKELVSVAQQLREQATKAKMAAIEANYEAMMDAADQMLIAADKAKESRDQEIEAAKKEAWGQIASGIITIALTATVGGITKNAQLGGTIGQAGSSISSGVTTLVSSQDKLEASQAEYFSDLANVAKQRLEAAAKLIEQQSATAEDLREIARSLRDMILKLYQDFIASQNEVIRRANV